MPFIFVSGYIPEPMREGEHLADPRTSCLSKPFDPHDLVLEARRLLALSVAEPPAA